MNEIFLEVVFAAFTEAVEVFESKKESNYLKQGTQYLELANDAIDFKKELMVDLYSKMLIKLLKMKLKNSELKSKELQLNKK